MTMIVTGGEQRGRRGLGAGAKRWYRYRRGHIVRVTPGASPVVETSFSYESPPNVVAEDDPAILFKQGTRQGDRLYLTTPTEVLTLEYPSLQQLGYVSLPSFHDVHHVVPTATGTLLVVNTGLDQLVEVTQEGEVVERHSVIGDDPWSHHDPKVDYRQITSLKPYQAHPNHVFLLDGERWVTRFECRDAVSIDDPSRRIEIGIERVHDGVVHDGYIYFTTVDGHVAIVDSASLKVVEVIDLGELSANEILGWCRGVLVDGDHVWIGFSRLRPTAVRDNVAWVREGFRRSVGTHIAKYDLARPALLERVVLEETSPLNAVFSIMHA